MRPLPSLALARCHHPVAGLGVGRRTGIWLQGCSIRCRGCVVPETWDALPRHQVPLAALLARLQPWLAASDGVTVSGGEPFDQPEALAALLAALRPLCPGGDLLVYSGHPWHRLQRRFPDILALADVVVSEPFVATRRAQRPGLAGSTNQQVHRLSALGHQRYPAGWQPEPAVSVARSPDGLELAGILAPGELPALVQALARQGWATQATHDAV